MQMINKESRGGYIYIIKKDFKLKTVTRDKEGHYIVIKGSIENINSYKYICTQHQSTQIYKTNIDKQKGEIELQHNNSRRLDYPIPNNRWNIQIDINKDNNRLERILDQTNLTDI